MKTKTEKQNKDKKEFGGYLFTFYQGSNREVEVGVETSVSVVFFDNKAGYVDSVTTNYFEVVELKKKAKELKKLKEAFSILRGE